MTADDAAACEGRRTLSLVAVEEVELREIGLHLRAPFRISSGTRQERRVLLVKLVTSEGVTGVSECVAGEDPGYSYETTATAWDVLTKFLVPGILGRELSHPEAILEPVAWVRGHRMAKAALEMAAWDAEAKLRGVSLTTLLGGTPDPVPVGVSVGIQETDDELLRQVEGYLEEGYRKIKIKIAPGRDAEMLRAVRERFPEAPLMADANSAYTLDDTPRLQELDELELLMLEQPLAHDDYLDHARLQESLRTPICLDESIRSPRDARLALELKSCRVVNIKPGRVGGFAASRAIHDMCRERGVPVWCGGMLESGVGRAHNLALATLPGFTIPGDISASRRYWKRDVVEPEFVVEDGCLVPPDGPGIGVELRQEEIERLTTRVEVYRA